MMYIMEKVYDNMTAKTNDTEEDQGRGPQRLVPGGSHVKP